MPTVPTRSDEKLTPTPDQSADRAAAAVLAIPAPIARRLLEVADYAISIRGQVEDLLDQFEELGQVLELPDADATDPDYALQQAWWDLTGQALVCRVLQELPVLLDRQGFDGGPVEPAEARAEWSRRVKDGPLGLAAGPALDDDPGIVSDPAVPASAPEADVSGGRRPAKPSEVCTCGDPAKVVYETARFGDVGHCGVEHRGTFS